MPRTEILADARRFAALAEAWDSLWQRAGGERVFQRHDWLNGWLSGMAERREMRLAVALAWEGEVLVGALPCVVHRRSGVRLLQWTAQLFSDYCDGLVDPAHTEALPLMWDALWRGGGFDLVNLRQVRPDAACRGLLDGMVAQGTLCPAGRPEHCMGIENQWADGEAFFRSLNKKGRNNHTRGKRILGELGGNVTFRVLEPGDDVSAEMTEMIRLKEDWLRQHDPGSLLLTVDGPLLRRMLRTAWDSGLAKLFLLEAGGRIAAASLNFVYDGRMEAYFTTYDPTFDRASPGTILIVDYAKWSFDRGLRLVDFLRGEEPFKFRLANADTVVDGYTGCRTLVGQMANMGHRWLARLRPARAEAVAAAEELEAA